ESNTSSNVTVTSNTIVKDLVDGLFYEFDGTVTEGQAITDLSGITFASDGMWKLYLTDLGTEDYSDTTKWELFNAGLKLTKLANGEGWTLIDGSGAAYVLKKDGSNLSASQSTINSVSAAAAVGVGLGLKAGVAVSGAGAFSQNVILSKISTSIRNSVITSGNDVLLSSKSNQTINSVVVAASVAVGGGGKAGVGVAIGASIARNLIGYDWDWSRTPSDVRAYVEDSSIDARWGDLIQTAEANQTINSAVIAGSVGIGAGKTGVAVSGSGVFSENWIGVDVASTIDGSDSIIANDITLEASDTSIISALAAAASIAASFALDTGVSVAIGVSLAHNTISSSVQSYIRNADDVTASGNVIIKATGSDTINAVSAAASVAAAFAGKTAVGVSGAGAEATNVILTKTNAYIENSILKSTGNVDLDALNTSEINAVIVAASFSLAIGGKTGVGASIGLAVARNLIGWEAISFGAATYTTNEEPDQIVKGDTVEIMSGPRAGDIYKYIADDTIIDPGEESNYLHGLDYGNSDEWRRVDIGRSPAEVQAYVVNSGIDSEGTLTMDALSMQSINAIVFAGSVAASGGASNAVSVSGAGAGAENRIATQVRSFITEIGTNVITADSVSLIADDSSSISVIVGAASVAAAFSGGTGVSVAIGVAGAFNEISNEVDAFIQGADVTTESGDIALSATTRGKHLFDNGITVSALDLDDAAKVEEDDPDTEGTDEAADDKTGDDTILGTLRTNFSDNGTDLVGELRISIMTEGKSWALATGGGLTYFIEWDGTKFSVSQASISAVTAAASIAASFSAGGTTVAVAGAGAFGMNIVLTDTRAFIENSTIDSKRDVIVEATNSSGIASVTGALAASVAAGTGTSVGVSIGAAIAFNYIGYKWDSTESPASVYSYISNSSVDADRNVILSSSASQTIGAITLAGSAALAASGGTGVAVAGSGVLALNMIGADVKSYIDGGTPESIAEIPDRINTIGLSLTASDTSTITALVGAASIAVSFGSTGVSVAVAVSLGHNMITSDVAAYIVNVDDGINATGAVNVKADEKSVINVVSSAAAVSAAFGSTGVAVSGAGAEASNLILTKTNAYIQGSTITNSSSVDVISTNSSEIKAVIVSAALAVAAGSTGVGVSIGVSLAGNMIGWEETVFDSDEYDYTTGHDPQILKKAVDDDNPGDRVMVSSGVRAGNVYEYVGEDVTLYDHSSGQGSKTIDEGDLVKVDAGYDKNKGIGTTIYRYLGDDDDLVNLAAQDYIGYDYASGAGNTTLNNGDRVKLVPGYGTDDDSDNIKGDGMAVYRYLGGSDVDRDLSAQDYTDTSLWESVDVLWESVGSARLTTQDYGNTDLWRQVNLDEASIAVNAYVLDSSIMSNGEVKVEAVSTQTIDAIVISGSVAASAGSTGVSVAGAGSGAINLISADVMSYINGNGELGIDAGSISLKAEDKSTINAITGAATLAAGFGGTGVAVAIGIAAAHNSISNEVSSYIINADDVNAKSGGISIQAIESSSISTITTAASLSVAIGGTGVAVSGAGAAATNAILTKTNAYVMNSDLSTTLSGNVIISASDTSKIDATVAALAAAVAGGGTGVGVAIGASYAGNMIGYDLLLGIIPIKDAAQVQAYVDSSKIIASGDVTLTATAEETITSWIFAGSVAIAAGGTAVGVGGSGVLAINLLATDIKAYISGSSEVKGNSVILTADDTSRIMAYGGAAAITGGFGGTGVAVSIGVALAHNMIHNDVAAYITGSTVTSTGGNIEVNALEHSQINSVSAAAALAVGIGGTGVAVSGAGAEASNVVLTKTKAYVDDSVLDSAADIAVIAKSLSAAPTLNALSMADKATADAFAQNMDDAGSTDADNEETTDVDERVADIGLDNGFLVVLSGILTTQGIMNSGALAVTVRSEGEEWSVVDRLTGSSYTVTREGNDFTVTMPTIGATVISAAAAIAGGSVGVGVSIGLSFARNLIGWQLKFDTPYNYTTDSDVSSLKNDPDSDNPFVYGDRVKIEEGVRAGDIYEYVGEDVDLYKYTTASGSKTVYEDDLVKVNRGYDENKGAETSIYRYLGNTASINLGVEDYTDTDLWKSVGSSRLTMQDYGNTDLWKQVNLAEAAVEAQAYIMNSSVDAIGDVGVTAVSDQSIDALVVAGSAAVSGGATGVSVAGAGAVAINTITTDIKASIDYDNSVFDSAWDINSGSVTIEAEDTSRITAVTGAAALAAAFGGVGVAVSIGFAGAYNEISNEVSASISDADVTTTNGAGAISVTAVEGATINALTAAASLAVSIGGTGVSVSGAGAMATNVILTTTKAYVSDSTLVSAGGVSIDASDTSTINAIVLASTAAIAGGGVGVGVSIGGAFATNLIGTADNPAGAQAYVTDSTITATGAYTQNATSEQTIRSAVIATSVAIAPGGVGVAVSGSGVLAINLIIADIKAFVEGSTITAGSVDITADDTSRILAFAGSASAAASFGGVGVSVSIGVALAHNMIANNVAAYIMDSSVTSTTGSISVHALEHSQINAVSTAASIGVAIGGVGVSVSGAGAEATNFIFTKTNAYVEDSVIVSAADFAVTAESLSAAPTLAALAMADKATADAFAQGLDDAGSTDTDNEGTTEVDERVADITLDNTFLIGVSGILLAQGIMNSGSLAATVRSEGEEWSLTDRVTGSSYVITRDGNNFTVTMPTIGATVIAAAADVAIGGVGVGVTIGLSFARNMIGWQLKFDTPHNLTTDSDVSSLKNDPDSDNPFDYGDRVRIEEGVRAGDIYEYVGEDVDLYKYHTGEGTQTIYENDLVKVNRGYDENKGAETSIYRYLGDTASINLGIEDYTDTDLWESIGSSRLTMQDYGNTDLWKQVNLEAAPVEVQAYIMNSSVDAIGDVGVSAISDQSIDALVVAGAAGVSAGGVGVSVAGAGAVAINTITTDINASIEYDNAVIDPSWDIHSGSVTIEAEDTSRISAVTGAAALTAAFGGVGVGVSIGFSGAYNEISNEVSASITDADVTTTNGAGAISVTAVEGATINALTTAVSLAVGIGGVGVAVSGAGAMATNVILTTTKAYVSDSTLVSAGGVSIEASDTSTINAIVLASTAAIAGGAVGVGVSVGGAFATNLIGTADNPAGAQAYVTDSTITATGAYTQSATSKQTIRSAVLATSVAIAPGGVGVAVSGSGVLAINLIIADIKAFIEGSTITAGSVDITADDTSRILAFAGSASAAASFGGVGVSVSIGVALAHNMIANNVVAYIMDSSVTSTTGSIGVHALEHSQINAVSSAASIGVAIGGVGVSVSGAGAEATNFIFTKTNSYVDDSVINSAADVDVTAKSLSAAPTLAALAMADKAAADAFAQGLDDAGSTDTDNEGTTEVDERVADITLDNTFLVGVSGILLAQGIMNSGSLAATVRSEGEEWSVTDRVTGSSYVVTRDGNSFTVTMPTIGATVIAAAADVAIGGVGVGVTIGLSFARNMIGWQLKVDTPYDYTTDSDVSSLKNDPNSDNPFVYGDRVKIEEGVRAGDIYEYVGEDVDLYKYTTSDGSKTIYEDDLVKVNRGYDDTKGAETSIYRYLGNTATINLGIEDYTDTDLWESIGSSRLTMQDYGNTDLWKQVNLEAAPVEVLAYIMNSSVDAIGDVGVSAVSDQSIDALVVAGAAGVSGGAVGVSVAGAGAVAINTITTDIKASIGYDLSVIDPAWDIYSGSVTIEAEDTSRISAVTGAAALTASFGGVGVGVSIGFAGAYNEISNEVSASITDADVTTTNGAGAISVTAVEGATINALTTAVSLAVGIGGVGVAVSGAGAMATNVILTTTEAYVTGSTLVSAGGVSIEASDTSTINAVVLASTAAIAGGAVGVGVSVGGAFATNLIGTADNPAGAEAYVKGSTITATGAYTQSATSKQIIRSAVLATSVALAGGGIGVGVSGSGVLAINLIIADIKAFIEGSTITAGSLDLTADDTSQIMAFAGAASVAATLGGVGVSVSIGVALAHNMIANNVAAYIMDSSVTSNTGSIGVHAIEQSQINAVSAAASLAVAAGVIGASISGAGAQATNMVLTKTNAYVENSALDSGADVNITAESLSASPPLESLIVGDADLFALNMDDAASTDEDDEDTTGATENERVIDIGLDNTFLGTLSGFLTSHNILNSGSLSVTVRSEGKEWSVTDRVTGSSYVIKRAGSSFTVTMPTIAATVVSASVAAAAGLGAVGASLGLSFAANLIGWGLDVGAPANYTMASTPPKIVEGDRVRIEDGVKEGYVYEYRGPQLDPEDGETSVNLRTQDYGNTDLWKQVNLKDAPAEVRAYVKNSSIMADGDLILRATSDQSIEALVVAGSAAVTGGAAGWSMSGA
ncbi:MAG: hypothetical protein HN929_03510, partial [Chloroflexi bacterium]|nr:hypothetical protein [Chloroflexota bacterium]